jgi:hypothetical protein
MKKLSKFNSVIHVTLLQKGYTMAFEILNLIKHRTFECSFYDGALSHCCTFSPPGSPDNVKLFSPLQLTITGMHLTEVPQDLTQIIAKYPAENILQTESVQIKCIYNLQQV